jgi:hypothetical protein
MVKIQITYFDTTGKYKPVASVIEVPSTYSFYKKREYWVNRAKSIIKAKRYWTDDDMEKFGYTEYKAKILPLK